MISSTLPLDLEGVEWETGGREVEVAPGGVPSGVLLAVLACSTLTSWSPEMSMSFSPLPSALGFDSFSRRFSLEASLSCLILFLAPLALELGWRERLLTSTDPTDGATLTTSPLRPLRIPKSRSFSGLGLLLSLLLLLLICACVGEVLTLAMASFISFSFSLSSFSKFAITLITWSLCI